jgi:iron complex outermembrane receptor protein
VEKATCSRWALIFVAALAASPSPSVAQNATGLDEIVVTAQRREQNQQNVPITVATISDDVLNAYGPINVTGIATSVSGLEIHTSAGGVLLYLRGVGYSSSQIGTDSPVGLYVDGVYQPFAQAGLFQLNNIERVEVLYGPQGTLFGRNTSGGVVQLVTADPSETPHADASVGYGNYNTTTVNFYGTTGLGHGLAGDLAFASQDQKSGWGSDLALDSPLLFGWDHSVRSKLKWTNDDGTAITLTGAYYNWNNDMNLIMLLPGGAYKNPGFYNGGELGTRGALDTAPNDTGVKIDGTLRVSQDFEAFSVVDILAYQNGRTSTVIPIPPINAITQSQRIFDGVWTEELQVLSAAGSPVTWVGGIYVYDETGATDLVQAGIGLAPAGGGTVTLDSLDTHSYAGYGQATFKLPQSTRLTLGGRYTKDLRNVWGTVTPYVGRVTAPNQQDSWDKFTGRVSLDHDFAPHVLGYASFNSGYKSGGFSITNPTAPAVQPEQVDAYEIGLKTELFDRRLRFNSSAFYYKYTNLQFRGLEPNTEVQLLLNAKAARIYGIDVDLEAQATQALTFHGSFEYLNAKYTDFANAQVVIPGSMGFTNGRNGIGNVDGNQLPQSPTYSAVVGANYTVEVGPDEIGFAFDAKYTDDITWNPDNLLRTPPEVIANASGKWMFDSRKYDVTLYSNNLLNRQYYSIAIDGAPNGLYVPAPPRTYGIRFGAHF